MFDLVVEPVAYEVQQQLQVSERIYANKPTHRVIDVQSVYRNETAKATVYYSNFLFDQQVITA